MSARPRGAARGRLPLLLTVLAAAAAPASTPAAPQEARLLEVPAGASLEAARDAARELLRAHPDDAVTIELGPGVHRLSRPLRLGPADGGGPRRRVTWRAAEGARATLSGAAAPPRWRAESDGTWSAPAPDRRVRQLLAAGARRPPARWPREGWLRLEAPGPDGRTSFRFTEGDLGPWEAGGAELPDGAEVILLHDWSMSRVDVRSIDGAERWIQAEDRIGGYLPFFHLTNFEPHPRFALVNVQPGWTAPGDWWHDVAGGRVRYRPLEGERPEDAALAWPGLDTLVEVRGTPDARVEGLTFEGLTFTATCAMSPVGGYAGIQAAFHDQRAEGEPGPERASPAAVRVERAARVDFRGCAFDTLGASALWLGEGVAGARVDRCRFEDVGANGLMIGTPDEPEPSESALRLTREVACADSTFVRCGALYLGAVGVWIGLARDVHVHHNELQDLPYTGVSLGWIWSPRPSASRGHVIERNHIHHVMQQLSDGGGIYTIGRHPDSHLRHNLIHDVPVNLGRAGSNGLFIDEGSSALTISHNVIHSIARSPVRFHKAGPCVLRDNVLVRDGDAPTYRHDACDPAQMTLHGNSTPSAPPDPDALEAGPRRAASSDRRDG